MGVARESVLGSTVAGPTCGAGVGSRLCVRGGARTCAQSLCAGTGRACVVRAPVLRVCTGVAAAGARPGRGSACPSLCAPARRSAESPPAKSVHAWGE